MGGHRAIRSAFIVLSATASFAQSRSAPILLNRVDPVYTPAAKAAGVVRQWVFRPTSNETDFHIFVALTLRPPR